MSSCEKLVLALQLELDELKLANKILSRDLKSLQAQVNIKVMNGQWHMNNSVDADELEIKETLDE